MKTQTDLKQQLEHIDHQSYGAYKALAGQYDFGSYTLSIDHVQGDPFASPSKLRVIVPSRVHGFPATLFDRPWKKIALQDYLTRLFYQNIREYTSRTAGSGKSGLVLISRCGQEVLERTAVLIDPQKLEARFEVGFPAQGRRIISRELEKILFLFLPKLVEQSLRYGALPQGRLKDAVELAEDQQYIREELKKRNLVAFVANGAILPRESGVSDRPLRNAAAFHAPDTLTVELELPHRGKLRGMGIGKGITLIVGGGYHGKSTLLKALELGVYNHIRGDGREYVITDDAAVKIRAEDGRSIVRDDISLFINHLPNGADTKVFTTENASGSTSQAANMIEGIEAGASLFLIDEDTSATNFMIRDEVMQRLISSEKEPITPFIEMARPIFHQWDISTILVVGSSGTYFDIADTVIQMDAYEPKDITAQAKALSEEYGAKYRRSAEQKLQLAFHRRVMRGTVPKDDRGVKIKVLGMDALCLNKETIDLRYVEQLQDSEQIHALGQLMRYAEENLIDGKKTLQQVVAELLEKVARDGLISVAAPVYAGGTLAMPRKQEIIACCNRCRSLKLSGK